MTYSVPKCRINPSRSASYPILSALAPLRILLAIVACFLCSNEVINAQGKVTEPKIGSPERKAIMDAMRGSVSKYAKTEVIFTGSVSLYEGWAKLNGHVSPKNGKQFAEDVADELELDFLAILQKVDGEWKTLYYGWSGDIGTIIEAREKFPHIPEILLPNLNGQATQEADNSFAVVTPVPQLQHNSPLSCASVSLDKKFVVTGDDSGVVKIWNIKPCFLIKSLHLGSKIVAVRLSHDLQNIFIISKQNRESPLLRSYKTTTWLLSHELELSSGRGNDAGDAFISEDCSHAVVTGGFEGDEGVFLITPLKGDANGDVQSEQRANKAELLQRFPELGKTSNCLEQFGFFAERGRKIFYNNGEFLLEQRDDLKWVLKKENLVIISSPGVKAICNGLDLKNFRLFAHSGTELRSIDIKNLSYTQCFSPDGIIKLASPSPEGDKFALISDLEKNEFEATIMTQDGQILSKKNISSHLPRTSTFEDSESIYEASKNKISWINDHIFFSTDGPLSCFTDQWDMKNRYDEAAVCNLGNDQTVIVLPIEGQPKSDLQDDYYKISVRDYPSGRERNVLTRPNRTNRMFYPGDIDAKAERIAKVENWRGAGELYVGNKNSMTVLSDNSTLDGRVIDHCAYVGNNLVLIGPSSNYDGSTLKLLDAANKYQELDTLNVPKIDVITFDKKNAMLAGLEGDAMGACYKIENNKFTPLARVLFHEEGYTLFTFDMYYLSMGKISQVLRFGKAMQTYPFEQFDLRLNRPDIVLERLGAPAEAIAIAKQLREKRLRRMSVTEEMLQPDFHVPEIEIISQIPATSEADYVNVSIKASDSRYPLDRLRVYVNNVPINGTEGESIRDLNTQTLDRTIQIKLAVGRNKIQVSVLNSAGAESLYANAEVNCSALRPKPTLYAVAMGVSEYSNPDWNLKYAAKDARDILDRIRSKSGSSYGEVKELLLTDREVTKETLAKVREFLSQATIDDTVLIFVAGHGLLDSKYDYYFGTSDIDFNNPSEKGIAFEEFDDLLAEVPCLRKSFLIDTCHAGELDVDEKKALAASQLTPSDQLVAMHPVGARGMSVKPIEGARGKSEWYDRLQGLFVDLRRGSGSTILSSSAGAEYALESSEQQNGLFTYAVLEALDGTKDADANKDGSVQMSEVGEYVKKRVAELTNHKQTPNTRRVNLEGDFVLSKSK